MNILGIVGSPRKGGNSEIMVKEISRQIAVPHQLNLLRLPDFNLHYCTGCYRCLFKKKRCVLKDDFQVVLDAIASCDALIVAVPAYFFAAHASLKTFVDRGLAFYGMADNLWEKPAVGVGIAGIDGMEGGTLLDVERFLMSLRADTRMSRMLYGALPGEIFDREDVRKVAVDLAAALSADLSALRSGTCPFCSGESFKILSGDKARCLLCGVSGRLSILDGKVDFTVDAGQHALLIDRDEALAHRDWLSGMVDRFKQEKPRLKKITEGYADVGTWILPHTSLQ